jgi:hypothetical protein
MRTKLEERPRISARGVEASHHGNLHRVHIATRELGDQLLQVGLVVHDHRVRNMCVRTQRR